MVDRNEVFGDMDRFDKKLKVANHLAQDASSDEEQDLYARPAQPMGEVDILKEKNRILMEKLFKS